MGQKGVQSWILLNFRRKPDTCMLTKEPASTGCAEEPSCFLIPSSSEWTQLPPYLSFTGERDHVIRRTEMPTHILRRTPGSLIAFASWWEILLGSPTLPETLCLCLIIQLIRFSKVKKTNYYCIILLFTSEVVSASENQMSPSNGHAFLTWTVWFYFISSTGFVHKGATKYLSFFILSLLKKARFQVSYRISPLDSCLFIDLGF